MSEKVNIFAKVLDTLPTTSDKVWFAIMLATLFCLGAGGGYWVGYKVATWDKASEIKQKDEQIEQMEERLTAVENQRFVLEARVSPTLSVQPIKEEVNKKTWAEGIQAGEVAGSEEISTFRFMLENNNDKPIEITSAEIIPTTVSLHKNLTTTLKHIPPSGTDRRNHIQEVIYDLPQVGRSIPLDLDFSTVGKMESREFVLWLRYRFEGDGVQVLKMEAKLRITTTSLGDAESKRFDIELHSDMHEGV